MKGVFLMSIVSAMIAAGCGAPERIGSEADAVRYAAASDLALEIIVRAGRDRGEHHGGAENRSAHYLLLPDGSLHVGVQGRGFPPRQRILSRDELAGVRMLIDRLDERFEAASPVRTAEVIPEAGGLRVVIDIREPASVRMTIHAAAPGESIDPEVAAVVRYLAALSWKPDFEPARQQLAPRRYDLGPDPHARFRRPVAPARPD